MELNLLVFINPIIRWKEYCFCLFDDEILYGKIEEGESKHLKSKHLSQLSFPQSIEHNKTNIVKLTFPFEDAMEVSSNEPQSLDQFKTVLTYLKGMYNCNRFIFRYMFTILHKSASLRCIMNKIKNNNNKTSLSVMIGVFSEKIKDKSPLAFDLIKTKLESYEKEVNDVIMAKQHLDNQPSLIKEILNHYQALCQEANKKNQDINQILNTEVDYFLKVCSFLNYHEGFHKILIEINKTILQLSINKKDKVLPQRDIILSFIQPKAKKASSIENTIQLNNNELNARKCEAIKQQIILKEKIKNYLKDTDSQLFNCFTCGNVLFITSGIDSTCHFDSKCTSHSLFSCRNCNIAYCTYCVPYYKNNKCAKGHLLFQLEGSNVIKKCVICFNFINPNEECAGCTICELPICIKCFYRIDKANAPNCIQCYQTMSWKRSLIDKCGKCKVYTQCYWFCFFCYTKVCCYCYSTPENYCGVSHDLELIDMNKDNAIDIDINRKSNMSINSFILEYRKRLDIICVKCKKVFNEKYYSCNRCRYHICKSCNNVKEDWDSIS